VIVDFDEPLTKEVCKDCGICVEYCPTTALSYAEGMKKEYVKDKLKAEIRTENGKRSQVFSMLKEEQSKSRYISRDAMGSIAQSLGLSLSEVYGVATFYSFLSTAPQGRHVIRICKSLPCYMKNASMIIEAIEKELGIMPGEKTKDGRFSFELTNCIGACDKAPAMLVDNDVYGHLTPGKIKEILRSYD